MDLIKVVPIIDQPNGVVIGSSNDSYVLNGCVYTITFDLVSDGAGGYWRNKVNTSVACD